MRISRLQLTDFRSYEELDVEFGDGVTTLVGANGEGKTNIVEAIRYLSTLQSHRVATDAPLIRNGTQRAVIAGRIDKAGRSLTCDITINSGRANEARLNRSPVRPRDLLGVLRTVVFSPEDLALVKGDPGIRRGFLDELSVVLQPTHAGILTDFDRVLRQRSSMLKTARLARGDLTTLDIWDEKFAQLGARILLARERARFLLAPFVAQAYAHISSKDTPCLIAYQPSGGDSLLSTDAETTEQFLLESVRAHRDKEIERGVCLVGPHRDELEVSIGKLPVKGYASHGESWSAALAMRWATYGLMTAEDGPQADQDGEPVVLLDDVFAELDHDRRAALAGLTAQASQVIVTAAVQADVPVTLEGDTMVVSQGSVTMS